jgi:hypothetical protein
MKAEFLKIAKVKSDKAFYKKYPTEAAFFKAHPEAKKLIKKAQFGTDMSGVTNYLQGINNVPDMQNLLQGQMQSPGLNASMFSANNNIPNPVGAGVPSNVDSGLGTYNINYPNTAAKNAGKSVAKNIYNTAKNNDTLNKIGESVNKYAPIAGTVLQGFSALKAGKAAKKEAQKWAKVTGVQADAAESTDIDNPRQFADSMRMQRNAFMPVNTGEEFFPINGVGTNVLAKNGKTIDKAEVGTTMSSGEEFPWNIAGQMGSRIAGNLTGNDGGGQIGGAIGGVAGSIFGPAGQAIGSTLGTAVGGLLDTNDRDQRKAEAMQDFNINRIAQSQFKNNIQNQFGAFMEDGGNIYRSGGHLKSYTNPSERAMKPAENGTALNGTLEPMWGGNLKDVSYNPYTGPMSMAFGNYHNESDGNGNTGVGVQVLGEGGEAANQVEVQPKEPIINTGDSVTVLGGRTLSKTLKESLGIKKGNTFQKAGEEIGKLDNKINSKKAKVLEKYSELNPITSFDKLKATSLKMMSKGLDAKQKINADKLMALSNYQNDSEEISNMLGYEDVNKFDKDLKNNKLKINNVEDSDNMKTAKYGAAIEKAQDGKVTGRKDKWSYTKAGNTGNPVWDSPENYDNKWTPSVKNALSDKERAKKMIEYINNSNSFESNKVKNKLNKFPTEKEKINFLIEEGTNRQVGPIHYVIDAAIKNTGEVSNTPLKEEKEISYPKDNSFETIDYKQNPWISALNQALPYLRPTDQEKLNPRQLMGELNALSDNQLEPVQARSYNPQLDVPYDISLQDQINAITAGKRVTQRMVGYNPAAQANIAAQAYGAESNVLAEQFRANQAMKDRVYSGNRATLNDAQLKNLGIYDQQYLRQEQAKSIGKATKQAALNSMTDKYAKNALENKTLGIYENLYNYRYDKAGRAVNMNPLFQPTIPQMYNPGENPNFKIVRNNDGTLSYVDVTDGSKGLLEAITERRSNGNQVGRQTPSLATPSFNPNAFTGQQSYGPTPVNYGEEYQEYGPINEEQNIPINQNYRLEGIDTSLGSYKKGGKINKKYSQSSIVRAFK